LGRGSGAITTSIIAFIGNRIAYFPLSMSLHDAADWGAIVTGAATLGLLAAAVGAGIVALRQLRDQRVIAERRRVYDHLGAFSDVAFLEMSAEADQLFRTFREDTAKGKTAWEKMSASDRARIQGVMNFYEEVASEYNADFLDKQAAELSLIYVAITIYEHAGPMIEWIRESDPAHLEEWKRLYDKGDEILARRKEQEAKLAA
jgi:hypothetical protein